MTKERKERIEELREKLQLALSGEWGASLLIKDREIIDLLSILSDYEAALPLLEVVRKSCPEYLQGELMDLRRLRAKHESEILSEALPILRAALAYGERRNSSINGYPDSVKRVLAPPEPIKVATPITDLDMAELLTDLLGKEDIHEGFEILEEWFREKGIAVEEEK